MHTQKQVDRNPIIIDTETTGLKQPQAIEVAYFELETDISKLSRRFSLKSAEYTTQLAMFQERFKPSKPIDPFAEKIHGISLESLANCRLHTEFKLPRHSYFIAHNAIFDWRVLNCPKTKVICTKLLAQQLLTKGVGKDKNLQNHKLTTLIVYFYPEKGSEMIKEAHGAMQDCMLVYYLLLKLLERAPYVESWEQLCSMCKQPKELENAVCPKMPFGKHRGMLFADIPLDYLQWLSTTNPSQDIKNAIKLVLGSKNFDLHKGIEGVK